MPSLSKFWLIMFCIDFDIFAVRNYISNLYGELRFSDLFWVFLVFVEAARHTCTVVDVLRWSESTRF